MLEKVTRLCIHNQYEPINLKNFNSRMVTNQPGITIHHLKMATTLSSSQCSSLTRVSECGTPNLLYPHPYRQPISACKLHSTNFMKDYINGVCTPLRFGDTFPYKTRLGPKCQTPDLGLYFQAQSKSVQNQSNQS